MFYVIIGEDSENSLEKRMRMRSRHIERLNALKDDGRLLLAGPFPAIDSSDPGPAGFAGSLIVAEFESLAAAQTWADADPFLVSGVYQRVTVRPFKKVLP